MEGRRDEHNEQQNMTINYGTSMKWLNLDYLLFIRCCHIILILSHHITLYMYITLNKIKNTNTNTFLLLSFAEIMLNLWQLV